MENPEKLGVDWLQSLISHQGIEATVEASLVEDEFGASCWLIIQSEAMSAEQINALIGENGRSLDAVQYLANTTLNLGRSPEEQQPYTIELAGHRAKRKAELVALATEAAEQARETGQEFEMKALSSAERRQVHHFLNGYEGLETFSRGREPDRRLVVRQALESDAEPS
ncbi:MAG: R3H domain-containing nucleic acid-binding protein [Cyanobacteria bacterium P01_D01_bin.71]